ncbi:MAG: helix-turn-helix transcriptional regulator [Burkholderiales bacterium]|nr:helix-turn-helix transcriptional regulator [Burkholderiales bacterium]
MSQATLLVSTLKRVLKARGLTYAQVATHLQLSEASVKRHFSQQRFTLDMLEAICTLCDLELTELIREVEQEQPRLTRLSQEQEQQLVASPTLLLLAVCVLNHWTFDQIIATYDLTAAACVKGLLQLDRLGLIRLLPENKVRLKVARDFSWLPDGPIYRYFRNQVQADFLNASFGQPQEMLRFHHAMLSKAAVVRLNARVERLLHELAELHEDCVDHQPAERQGISLLVATRSWEPLAFEQLRRKVNA